MPAALKHDKRLTRKTERLGERGDLQTNLTDLEIRFRTTGDWTLLAQCRSHCKTALLGNTPRGESPPQKGTGSSWVILAFKPLYLNFAQNMYSLTSY